MAVRQLVTCPTSPAKTDERYGVQRHCYQDHVHPPGRNSGSFQCQLLRLHAEGQKRQSLTCATPCLPRTRTTYPCSTPTSTHSTSPRRTPGTPSGELRGSWPTGRCLSATAALRVYKSGPAPDSGAGPLSSRCLSGDHSPPASLARRAASCSSDASEPPVVSDCAASAAAGRADGVDSDE